jgi:hypothetical protein
VLRHPAQSVLKPIFVVLAAKLAGSLAEGGSLIFIWLTLFGCFPSHFPCPIMTRRRIITPPTSTNLAIPE